MRLCVAEKRFELVHDSGEMTAAAAVSFEGFAATTAPADWVLDFRVGPPGQEAREMSYRCTRIAATRFDFVSDGNFTGWLDTGTRRGEFLLSSPETYGISQRNVLRFALILDLQLAGGLVLHAASRAFRGEAYVFAGRSEVGKSTLSRAFPAADFLGDELCFIDAELRVHRTPFFGEVPAPAGEATAPLAMLVALAQAPQVALTPLTTGAAAHALLATTIHLCHDAALTRLLVDRVLALCTRLPVVRAAVPRFAPGELEPIMAALAALPRAA
jgi:hypothetical protein